MIREVLSYRILRQYMHAPLSNYAKVTVNGTLLGLYSNSQDVGNQFSADHFYSTGNTFFKCNPSYGGGNNHSDLVYYGADSSLYYLKYELQSDAGWGELVDLCDTLKNFTPSIEEILDIDRAIWMLAFDNATVNLDSYIGAIEQNYYLYRDNNGRFNPVIWDLNECFGTFANSGTGQPLNLSSMINLSPTLHSADANWPLVVKILANPRYKRKYIAHMRTLLNENFANSQYVTWAGGIQSTIDAAVQQDQNKFYSYAQFQAGLTQNVSGMGAIPGISNLMGPRNTYLQSHSEFQQVLPTLSNVLPSNATPNLGDIIAITAQVSGGTFVQLGYRTLTSDRFLYADMFDDGTHGDGNAGDGIFGAQLTCNSGQIQYYVYAENNNAGVFSPARAEHEFYSLLVATPQLVPGQVVLNEFLASNTSTVQDPAGQFADYVELFNTSPSALSLNGLYLTDDFAQPTKWAFPANTSIPAGGYLLVWADEDEFESGLHTNFKLSANGEQLMLGYANGTVLDSLGFGIQASDISMQRCPNGTGPWMAAQPSPGAVNTCLVGVLQAVDRPFEIYPNPAQTVARVLTPSASVRLYNGLMQETHVAIVRDGEGFLLDVRELPEGMYFVRTKEGQVKRLVLAR